MSRSAVQDILHKIDALPQKDRDRLDRALAARTEAEWKRLAKQARARERAAAVLIRQRSTKPSSGCATAAAAGGDENLFRH